MTSDLKSEVMGIKFYTTAPQTYTINYFNGSATYKEKFNVIQIPADMTSDGEAAIDEIMAGVTGALVDAGAATEGISVALAAIVDAAYQWLKSIVFNDDGSITLFFAAHYVGTAKGGIDPTFTPGGLDPDYWVGFVNGLQGAIGLVRAMPPQDAVSPEAALAGLTLTVEGSRAAARGPFDIMAAYKAIAVHGRTLIDGAPADGPDNVVQAINGIQVSPPEGSSWEQEYEALGNYALQSGDALTVDIRNDSGIVNGG